jgi:hypothetical protein
MHIFLKFFIFLFFFGLGFTQPARLDHWPKFTRAWHSRVTSLGQWSSRVINYLRTMLNALKIQKEWKGRESLPCRRLLCLSVSVLGEDQWRCSLLGNQNSSFYLCFPALCFFFSRLFCSIVHCPFVLSGFS